MDQPRRPRTGGGRLLIISILAVLSVAVYAAMRVGPNSESSPIQWHADLDAASDLALETDTPLLLDFTADWCPPCKWMKRNVFPVPEVVALLNDRFIPVQVDLTSRSGPNQELAKEYGIRGIPTLVVLNPVGQELDRVTGALEADQLVDWLSDYTPESAPQSP